MVTRPSGYTTWNGPYIADIASGDFAKDGWGVAYSYSGGVTIQSTGSGATITKQFAFATTDFTANTIQGVVHDAAGLPPGSANNTNITVSLTHPNGAGGTVTTSVTPTPTGAFTLSSIPVGSYPLQIIHNVGPDTIIIQIDVLPLSMVTVPATFGVALW